MSPWTALVEREFATTLPANSLLGSLLGIRSMKVLSIRLNAVVCELAMLPEMFSNAKDCARMPVTAVVRAPKIPITLLHCRRTTRCGRAGAARSGQAVQDDRAKRCKPRATRKY